MIDREAVAALARLAPNAVLTLQVKAADLARAFEELDDAPAELTPGKAAKRYGRSAKYWRARAAEGYIEGAYQDGDRWFLPSASCRAHLAAKAGATTTTTTTRRVRRGPRAKAAQTAGLRATD